jgi:hypothetical protein
MTATSSTNDAKSHKDTENTKNYEEQKSFAIFVPLRRHLPLAGPRIPYFVLQGGAASENYIVVWDGFV